ncbi:MAG: sterol desaturase family protein [Bacteroidota bacterium]
MQILVEHFGWLPSGFISAFFIFFRYALLAGLGYLVFYSWKKKDFISLKIQQKFPKRAAVIHEIQHALLSAVVFAVVGLGIYGLKLLEWSKVYLDISSYGWAYLLGSFVFLIIIHDTYFYWIHRLMHQPRLFKIFHLVHHKSNNPTP